MITAQKLIKNLIIKTNIKERSGKTSFVKCYAVIMNDEHGQVIHTFEDQEKADEFFKVVTRKEGYCSICGNYKSDEESTPSFECEDCGAGVIGFAHGCDGQIEKALCDNCFSK